MTYNQISINSTTPAQVIVAANPARRVVWITPTADVYIGDANAIATSGFLAKANVSYPLETTAAIYGICSASNTSTVTFLDLSVAGSPVPTVQ